MWFPDLPALLYLRKVSPKYSSGTIWMWPHAHRGDSELDRAPEVRYIHDFQELIAAKAPIIFVGQIEEITNLPFGQS